MYPITLTKPLNDIEICGSKLGDLNPPDFKYPWELVKWHQEEIIKNLELQIKNYKSNTNYKLKITNYENVVLDESSGPIVINENVEIKPFTYIEGPCYIGQDTKIQPHSQIRKNTSIGHTCKIGGEVSGSIIQPYTNKAHHGFVGDSYIGSWVNLGAGTTTSNLKNTYGNVRVKPDFGAKSGFEKIDTGMQFFGCVIGDYSKAAINTSIYTGKIIGVCAHLFGIISENVGSFIMKMPDNSQKEFNLEAALRMQERQMARRNVQPSKDDIEILKKVFRETKGERKF